MSHARASAILSLGALLALFSCSKVSREYGSPSANGGGSSSSSSSGGAGGVGGSGGAPVPCGDLVIDPLIGETCDPPDSCPVVCEDGDACTIDAMTGSPDTCDVACTFDPITACSPGDGCCPQGCPSDVDVDCTRFWATGILKDLPVKALKEWDLCWSGNYNADSPLLDEILNNCSKANLLLACRPVGSLTLTLAAMGPRADVLFDCGMDNACVHPSNGVGFYYSSEYSWGFAPPKEGVNRISCDYMGTLPEQRMCWHTSGGAIYSGYRCGANELGSDAAWERQIWQAD